MLVLVKFVGLGFEVGNHLSKCIVIRAARNKTKQVRNLANGEDGSFVIICLGVLTKVHKKT